MEIISANFVLPMDGEPLVAGAIAVENDEIIDVGPEKDLLKRYPDTPVEEYPNHAILPGLINAHSHLDMTHHKDFDKDPVRQVTADVNFVDWLLSCIEYKKNKSHEIMRASVEEGMNACIEAGTTCVADSGSYEGIFQCLEQSGLRAIVFPEVISYDSYVAQDLFETALALVEKYMDVESDLISVGIAPYSPFTLSRNLLKIMAQYCWSSGLPLMMHTAESFSEMEFFYNSSGDIATKLFPNIGWGDDLPPAFRKTPIAYLDEIDFLTIRPILVGCVQASPADIKRMAERGVKVVWCPRSNHYLKLGVAPIAAFINNGIKVALGTEGLSSTNTLSLWDEMRFALEMGRGLTPKQVLAMATTDAAQILGLADQVGTLTAGKKADYIVVDLNTPNQPDDIYSHLLAKTHDYHVRKVVVNGKTLKNTI